MKYLSIKNLTKYQHYKNRNPPWVKLYYAILDDYLFLALSHEAQLLYLKLLLIASRTNNEIPADRDYLEKVCRCRVGKQTLNELLNMGFLVLPEGETIQEIPLLTHQRQAPQPNGKDTRSPIPIPDDWLPKESHQKLATARGLELNIEAVHFKGKAQE